MRQLFIEPASEYFSASKFRIAENAEKKARVRFYSGDRVFFEGAFQARNRLCAVLAPGNQLAQHRIVFGRDNKTFVHAVIEADSGAGRRSPRKNLSGRREKLIAGILRVEAAFEGGVRKLD